MPLAGPWKSDTVPAHLRCEYRETPLGIDAVKPRLSWVIENRDQRSEVRGQKQMVYHVLMAKGVKFIRMEDGAAVYEVESRCFKFCSTRNY